MSNTNNLCEILEPGLNALFIKHYENHKKSQDFTKIASVIKSKSDKETYSWLTASPSLREFTDERHINALSGSKYTLENKTWEATIGIEREVIEDDLYGQIQLRIEDLASNAAKHKNRLVFETLANGCNEKCFDGNTFFAANHKYTGKSTYKNTQSNKNNLTLSADNLKTSINAMGRLRGTEGEYLCIRPNILVVPTELEWTAKELVYSHYLGESNSTNTLYSSLEVIVSPYITDQDSWYLLDCTGGLKPIILQERCKTEFTGLGKNSEEGFMRDLYLYGIRARYNAGYSFWQLAYANIPD